MDYEHRDCTLVISVRCFNHTSHSHRMGPAGRDPSRLSGPTSLLKKGHPRAHGMGLCPDGS